MLSWTTIQQEHSMKSNDSTKLNIMICLPNVRRVVFCLNGELCNTDYGALRTFCTKLYAVFFNWISVCFVFLFLPDVDYFFIRHLLLGFFPHWHCNGELLIVLLFAFLRIVFTWKDKNNTNSKTKISKETKPRDSSNHEKKFRCEIAISTNI